MLLNLQSYELHPIKSHDLERVLAWRNSERIRAFTFTDHIISWEEHLAWYGRVSTYPLSPVMVLHFQDRPIGTVALSDIDQRNNKCFWAIYLGETDIPKGSGSALGLLGLQYIFETFKIRKLSAEVFAFNTPSLSFHNRLGFTEEGTLVQHILKNDHFEDVVLFRYTAEEWARNKPMLWEQNFSKVVQP